MLHPILFLYKINLNCTFIITLMKLSSIKFYSHMFVNPQCLSYDNLSCLAVRCSIIFDSVLCATFVQSWEVVCFERVHTLWVHLFRLSHVVEYINTTDEEQFGVVFHEEVCTGRCRVYVKHNRWVNSCHVWFSQHPLRQAPTHLRWQNIRLVPNPRTYTL